MQGDKYGNDTMWFIFEKDSLTAVWKANEKRARVEARRPVRRLLQISSKR